MTKLPLAVALLAFTSLVQSATHDASPLADNETSFYHGTINATLEVELILTRSGNAFKGTYEYATHQEPLALAGTVLPDGSVKLSELTSGKVSAGFLLNDLLGQRHLDGKWNSADGKRSYAVHLGKIGAQQHSQLRKMWNDKGPIKSIILGDMYGCALRESGAWCWGDVLFMPSLATAGPGMVAQRALPNLLVPAGAAALAIGSSQSCLLYHGTMKCWQRSSNPDWFRFEPTIVSGFESDVTAIGVGDGFACGIVKGALRCWDSTKMNAENFVTLVTGVLGLSSGSPRCALLPEGFKCWTLRVVYSPPSFSYQEKQTVSQNAERLAASDDHGYNDSLVCWTQHGALTCSADRFRSESDKSVGAGNPFTDAVSDLAVAQDHSCIIWKGDAYCWGTNDHGQLGDGTRQLAAPRGAPLKVALPSQPRQIAVASRITCALTVSNEVYCWGANDFFQTGAASHDTCDMPNGHEDKISDPCNLKPVSVRGLPAIVLTKAGRPAVAGP